MLIISGMTISVLGAALYPLRPAASAAQASTSRANASPNIVLISLDTVRADHLSAYGYFRPTTPQIDRLAAQGVLFESAMAAAPWTLASHASMFTGLLPHQHGANWFLPLDLRFRTLAEILNSSGYETAGFTSNLYYGQDGWGMGQGFETFEDDSASRRHNLAATFAGRALVQPFYQHVVHYDLFDRRDARELNADVFRWFERRSSRPFFLFINYFDAHDPYLTGTAHDRRFGRISKTMVKQVNGIDGVRVPEPPSAEDQASLVAGYDNCVAFLDEQVGRLVERLRQSPAWANTVVIITSDHGEAFGEHERYGHGWNVYKEATHVPLIFVGPGIPSGLRIAHLARTREIFPTVLDLAVGEKLPLARVSLRRFWTPGFQPEAFDDFVISENIENSPELEPATSVGLMTSEWHYVHDRSGRVELYHWPTDPAERVNLADSTQHRETLAQMRGRLAEYLRHSVRPWQGAAYLFALEEPGYSFLHEVAFGPLLPPSAPEAQVRVGAAQSLFAPDVPAATRRPALSDEDLMKSLPYR
jgi:arylsulfatase A-like enzyme